MEIVLDISIRKYNHKCKTEHNPYRNKTFSPKRQLFHVPIYVPIVEFSILNDNDSDGYHRRYICNHVKLGINSSQVMVTIVHKRFRFLKKNVLKHKAMLETNTCKI